MPTYTPPQDVADIAREALEVRKEKPPSQRGGTAVGLARANQLANRRPVSIDTVYRMRSYFDRHEVDKQGATWNEYGKGKQAWNLWGGDAGRRWVNTIIKEYETMETKSYVVMEQPDGEEMLYCVMEDDNPEPLACYLMEELAVAFIDGIEYMHKMMDKSAQTEVEVVAEDKSEDIAEDKSEDIAEDDAKVDMTMEERNALPDEDFAIPSSRNFPVAVPQDIADAVSSWGRYRGDVSFDTFKQNLIAIAIRKGKEFYDMLPQAWRDEIASREESAKALALAVLEALARRS